MKRLCITLLSAVLLCSMLLPVSAWDNAAAKSLLNAAPLTPLSTGYTPLDQKVASIFSSLFDSSDPTYEKVKLLYDYVNRGSSYRAVNPSSSLYSAINKECNYYSSADTYSVARAYNFLTTKTGTCLDFADAFLVLARAIGLECYLMHGTYDYGPHYWNLIRLNGSYYIFDTEADWASSGRNGSTNAHYSFCLSESADSHRRCDRAACIAEFGSFRCRNKTNLPGSTVPGSGNSDEPSTTPAADASYEKGVYRTDEIMNFRSSPSLSGLIYMLIPAGLTLTVSEVSGVWGKVTYNGRTGWISLEYSTKIKDEEKTDLPLVTTTRRTEPETPKNEDGILGDVDGNGHLTAADARLVIRAAVGLEQYKNDSRELLSCDINKDGAVTAEDARLVMRIAVGLD